MSDINIEVPYGGSKRLLTSGKYCADDIVVSAGASGNLIRALKVSANGTYYASDDADGYSPVIVNVPTGTEVTSGTFTASESGTAETITHGLGTVPGTILFFKNADRETGNVYGNPGTDYSFYDSLFAAKLNSGSYIYAYNYVQKMSYYATSSSSSTTSRIVYSGNYNKATGENATYGLSEINEITFTTPTKLIENASYCWIAFKDEIM